jgi:glycosyltransferase involved in cell wall biosynthesis
MDGFLQRSAAAESAGLGFWIVMAKISILIPAYKAARFLPETLQSVEKQSYTDWELIVVEDGCFDATGKIVETFAAGRNQRVQLIRNDQNQGVAIARNQLIEAANGTILAWIDADDLWEPDHLSHGFELLEQEQADWFIGGIQRIDSSGSKTHPPELPPPTPVKELPRALLEKNFILTSTTLMKRSILNEDVRFDPNFKVGEDLDLFIRLAHASAKPAFSNRATVLYRNYPESVTGSVVQFNFEYSKVFESYLKDPEIGAACSRGIVYMMHTVIRLSWRNDPSLARQAYQRLVKVGTPKASARLRTLLGPLANTCMSLCKKST